MGCAELWVWSAQFSLKYYELKDGGRSVTGVSREGFTVYLMIHLLNYKSSWLRIVIFNRFMLHRHRNNLFHFSSLSQLNFNELAMWPFMPYIVMA